MSDPKSNPNTSNKQRSDLSMKQGTNMPGGNPAQTQTPQQKQPWNNKGTTTTQTPQPKQPWNQDKNKDKNK